MSSLLGVMRLFLSSRLRWSAARTEEAHSTCQNPPRQTKSVRSLYECHLTFHAQLTMVAQVDEISLTDLMMRALENHIAARRDAPDFKAKVQKALADAEAQMARTRAMLLGTQPEVASSPTTASADAPATTRSRRKDEASG
jgi:hypothetical protein